MKKIKITRRLTTGLLVLLLMGCSSHQTTLFTSLTPDQTGIQFRNILKENDKANVLEYTYFYNGGGVAIGDINNDGLPDILFTGNMVPNRLYLNKGNFNLKILPRKAALPHNRAGVPAQPWQT